MAPKRSGCDSAAGSKSKKVSQKRSELALEAMASEVDVQRKAEHLFCHDHDGKERQNCR